MNKPIIAIPSYKRPDGVALRKLEKIHLDKYLFIRAEEYDSYKDIAEQSHFKVIKLKDVKDVGETRQKLVKYCQNKGFEWVFMLDDDISKLELLTQLEDGKSKPMRRVENPEARPRFEMRAFMTWFKIAQKYNLSLSSPNGIHDFFSRGYLRINHVLCVQCVLLHIPDIVAVGNYKSLKETGNEDFYIQYKLMKAGYLCGKVAIIEYSCPEIGGNSGGNSAEEYKDLIEKYTELTETFMNKVCTDPKQIALKKTKFGQPYMRFAWRNWDNVKDIPLWNGKGELINV